MSTVSTQECVECMVDGTADTGTLDTWVFVIHLYKQLELLCSWLNIGLDHNIVRYLALNSAFQYCSVRQH